MLIVVHMINKFPAFTESETSLTRSKMLDNGSHPESVSQYVPFRSLLILFSSLRLVFESGLFLLDFQTQIMCAFPICHLRATCKPLLFLLIFRPNSTAHEDFHYVIVSIRL
jgi:hypothetical protein